jgi:hypothetical protein
VDAGEEPEPQTSVLLLATTIDRGVVEAVELRPATGGRRATRLLSVTRSRV